MKTRLRYRLALDLGSTSLGWAILKLSDSNEDKELRPNAIIKAGVRIFSDGREPAAPGQVGTSKAAVRRERRALRRRRDRLLKRKARMMHTLIKHGFFPQEGAARKALESLNPYTLRAKGLDEALTSAEFARALFHINQRRGFKSNRKTDKRDSDNSATKSAIKQLRNQIAAYPTNEQGRSLTAHEFDLLNWVQRQLPETQGNIPRTVGEVLHRRDLARETTRAKSNGLEGAKRQYELYIDRAMIEREFDALWAKQASLNPALFHQKACAELKDCLLFQRPLRPVKPGRCTLIPEEERAPLALPSTQRFRIYQEVNNLRILGEGLQEQTLTREQRDKLVAALEENSKRSFTQIKKLLGTGGSAQFNLEDAKRQELKGNVTSAILSKKEHFGDAWFGFAEAKQDEIVMQLVKEENEAALVYWLMEHTGIDEARAETIANAGLPEGYGSLSAKALSMILPALRSEVITYDKAVQKAGFEHHSHISHAATGEILPSLPYYAEYLQRHVGFGTGDPKDTPEKRYGKIANPTVHIGLNQVRAVVNALIKRYGHPSEVIIEVARELKQTRDQKQDEQKRQAENQKRNQCLRKEVAEVLRISEERVKQADLQKMILWEELSFDVSDRKCPYSGVQISKHMLLSEQVEIEHILPFSQTLDDSLNNKTVAMREANRIKGNRTPAQAQHDFEAQGWSYDGILHRAEQMPQGKRYRFGVDGYQKWLREDKGFLARALNDTRYLSRVAREYLSLICPQDTRVIPGQMTALLRGKFGLNDVLGLNGEKNRNDHRHHAVDACVIAITDQGMLQRFAQASASAREQQLDKLVQSMPKPWPTYREQVERAVQNIRVSHKPDHGHEDEMFDATIYSAQGKSRSAAKDRNVIQFKAREKHPNADIRHKGVAYKGLLPNSNYSVEIFHSSNGKWSSEVVSTYLACATVAHLHTTKEKLAVLQNKAKTLSGKPLIMRLCKYDYICAEIEDEATPVLLQVLKISAEGSVTFIKPNETNIPARYTAKLKAKKAQKDGVEFDPLALNDVFFQRAISAESLREIRARRVTVSPIGELNDPGFKG